MKSPQHLMEIVLAMSLSAVPELAAQEPLLLPGSGMMEEQLVTDENRLVSFQWFARRGYEYTVRTTVDLENWQDAGKYYGFGTLISLPVYQIPDPLTGEGGGLPPTNIKSAFFTLRSFPGLAKTLVTWKEPETSQAVMVVIPSNFSDVGSLPLFFDVFSDAGSGIRYELAFSVMPGVWTSDLDDYTPSLLTSEQQEKLAWFTGREGAIHAAMLAAGDPPGVVVAPPATGVGSRHFLVCAENTVDTDGDGLFDHFEIQFGTDWARADSDGDGINDYEEVTGGSNPNDPAATPGNGSPSPSDPEEDDDDDGLLNGEDFDPLDPNINWPRTSPPSYAFFQIPGAADKTAVAINNKGQVLLNGKDKDPAQTPSVYVWSPGDPQPVILPKGSLTITISKPDAEGNLVATSYPIAGSEGADLNDNGVIVGSGIFNAAGTPPATTGGISPSPPSVALRWAGVGSAPVLLHPGKIFIDETEGDLVLFSQAKLVNSLGDIVGAADTWYTDEALTPPNTSAWLPTRWDDEDSEAFASPIYQPNPTTELPANKRDINIARLYDTHFYPTGSYRGGPGSPEIPALWLAWQAGPNFPFAGFGSVAWDMRHTPNARITILTDERLMLQTKEGGFEPSLRKYPFATYLTTAGTIWTQTSKLIHATEEIDLVSLAAEQGFDLSAIIDVSSDGVALGNSTSGPLIMVPIQIAWKELPSLGNVSENKSSVDYVWSIQNDVSSDDGRWLPGRGLRIFPGSEAPGASIRNRIALKVKTVSLRSDHKVYLRVYDVDDPTPWPAFDSPVSIDPNFDEGADNIGSDIQHGEEFRFLGSSGVSNATVHRESDIQDYAACEITLTPGNEAEVILEITMQPGDNFRAALSLEEDNFNSVQITDKYANGYLQPSADRVIGFNGAVSELLTVWRTLHVEFDSMSADPLTEGVPADGQWARVLSWQSATEALLDASLNKPDQFYQNGDVVLGSEKLRISSQEGDTLHFSVPVIPTTQAIMSSSSFIVVDDDARGLPPDFNPILPRQISLDHRLKARFAPAYIELTDVGDLNTRVEIPFQSNAPLGLSYSMNDSRDVNDSAGFWNHLVVAAFQAASDFDSDPISEGSPTLGLTRSIAPKSSAIYLEAIRDQFEVLIGDDGPAAEYYRELFRTEVFGCVAHELAHAPSSFFHDDHSEGGLIGEGEVNIDQWSFNPETIRRFRATLSWGEAP